METYEINTAVDLPIVLIPQSELEEVLQNVRTIISTIKGTVPLDRDFGISGDIVDLPIHVAQAKLSNEIFQAVKQYEPRVTIEDITFSITDTGKLLPKVKVSI